MRARDHVRPGAAAVAGRGGAPATRRRTTSNCRASSQTTPRTSGEATRGPAALVVGVVVVHHVLHGLLCRSAVVAAVPRSSGPPQSPFWDQLGGGGSRLLASRPPCVLERKCRGPWAPSSAAPSRGPLLCVGSPRALPSPISGRSCVGERSVGLDRAGPESLKPNPDRATAHGRAGGPTLLPRLPPVRPGRSDPGSSPW